MRAPPRNAYAPTEVLADQGRGCKDVTSTDDATALTPKHKLKNVWCEGKGTIQSFDDLRRLTRDLETIADWLDDLRARIDRAHLRFQVVGLEREEQEELEAEVLKFKQVCAALCGNPRRLEQERRAA